MYLTGIRQNFQGVGNSNLKMLKSPGGKNVLVLGLVSMFTDISSEMVVAVIPLFLTSSLGFGIISFAVFEGIYQTASAWFRLWGGRIADRTSNPKKTAAWGYGISTVTRAGLFLSTFIGQSLALPFLIADRVGKGIRVAPRDTLISRSVPKENLATAFGVHRTLDTTGALLGPIAAFAILELTPDAYDSVFMVSLVAGIIGVSIIVLLAKNPQEIEPEPVVEKPQDSIWKVVKEKQTALIIAVAMFLTMATVGDSLIYLFILNNSDLDLALFPLLYAGTAFVYILLAVPVGMVSDKVGYKRVFLFGQMMLVPAYLILANATLTGAVILTVLALMGLYYTCTDGILAALASSISTKLDRGTTLGAVSMFVALAKLVSAFIFGIAWQTSGNPQLVLTYFAIALGVATVLSGIVISKHSSSSEKDSILEGN